MTSNIGQKKPGLPPSGPSTQNSRGFCQSEITSFFTTHYDYKNQTQQINTKQVYSLFKATKPNSPLKDLNAFKAAAGKLPGLMRYKMKSPRETYYKLIPKSPTAKVFHTTAPKKFDFFTGNIQGLISKNKGNKCVLLKGHFDSTNNNHHITALTETWLRKKQHYDGEIIDILPNHRIFRADRNISGDPTNPANLTSGGGCALITSPGVIAEKKIAFSNSNCELLIVECAEIALSVILVYRPAGVNFKLSKFKEVLELIDAYLSENAQKAKGNEIILTGDFNFPANVVEWIATEQGLIPNRKDGNSEEKLALGSLIGITNQFHLEQMVDKPTRAAATLDLVFTSIPELFSPCKILSLAQVSDHDLVSFCVENPNLPEKQTQIGQYQSEVSKINFKRANVPSVKQYLANNTDWDDIIGDANTFEKCNERFVEAIIKATQPGYPGIQTQVQAQPN